MIEFQGYARPRGEPRWSEEELAEAWRNGIAEDKRREKEEKRLVEFNENGLDALLDVESVLKPGRWYNQRDVLRECRRKLRKSYSPLAIASILKSLVISGKVRTERINVGAFRGEPPHETLYQVKC